MSGRPRLRGVGRVRAVYLVHHENRVLGVSFVGGGVRRDEAEHQGGTNRGATRGVGVADHRLRGVSRRQQTGNHRTVGSRHPRRGVDHQTARSPDVSGVNLGGIEGPLLDSTQGRIRVVIAVGIEAVVFVFAALEIQIHPRIGETVKALNGFLQGDVSEADSPAAPVPTTTTS